MTHNTKPISPLRQRMIEDMTLRKLSPKTQSKYIRAVINFLENGGKEAIITNPGNMERALAGETGTRITLS